MMNIEPVIAGEGTSLVVLKAKIVVGIVLATAVAGTIQGTTGVGINLRGKLEVVKMAAYYFNYNLNHFYLNDTLIVWSLIRTET